ncbi:hypothetical protein [Brachybacterium sp. GPGPB12]|uniref:hypothetical protein n=1 Tax=Brachybacterium sp. GPGPB12 TaxID=3023517 RepID=UPI0031342FBB
MTERGTRPTRRRLSGPALHARRQGLRDHARSLTKATPARITLSVLTLLIGVFTALLSRRSRRATVRAPISSTRCSPPSPRSA